MISSSFPSRIGDLTCDHWLGGQKALPLDIENKNMKSFMRYNCKNMLLIDCNSNPKGIARFRNISFAQRARAGKAAGENNIDK